ITNDSALNNGTAAEQFEYRLERRGIRGDWKASERRLSCFGHIIQLAIEDFMSEVTQTGLVESKQAIWEFNPS
ncbi:hypothetical protein C8Q80DRAFT_1064268, partial [Daedaleopsis nitida]